MKNKELYTLESPRIMYQSFSLNSVTGQCDACSPVVFARDKTPRPNLSYEFYYKDPALIKQNVNSSHYAVFSPFSHTFSVLNQSAILCLQHFNSPKVLENIPSAWLATWGKSTVQSTLEQLITLGLLVSESSMQNKFCTPSQTEVRTPVEVPNTLAAWLHITDCCNLRCAYCYLSHHNADMSLETGRAAIEATFRSALAHDYREVKFKYAGGEPLLRFETITELHRHAQILADQHELALDGVVLSNGTFLTLEIVKQMQVLGLRLMISLDGLERFHDGQRSFADGNGSFKAVAKAITLAISEGLIPDISITITGRNISGLPELITWVLDRDLPFSLNFYRKHDLSALESDLRLAEKKIIKGMLSAYKVIASNLPGRSLLTSLVDRANFAAPHLRTCSVGQSYLVFDLQGCVAKCQMDIGKTITDVHNPDPLVCVRENSEGIQNVTVEEKAECCDCQWRYWCAGGCPLLTYRATGCYNLKSPNCNIYKALYPEVIRLEGLRLLRSLQ